MILRTALLALLSASPALAACPSGQMAVGDDSERGYKCVPRAAAPRPSLKPSGFKTGNDKAADKSYGAGEQPATEPVGAEKRELGRKIRMKRKAQPADGCPKGWVKKGEGCAPPPARR